VILAATAMQAAATTTFEYTQLDDPITVIEEGTMYGAPSWWNAVDENTLSLDLAPVAAVDGTFWGAGIAPAWWIGTDEELVEGNLYDVPAGNGWSWSYNGETSTTLHVSNRAQDMTKEIWLWWRPTGVFTPSILKAFTTLKADGDAFGRVADEFHVGTDESGKVAAFAKWFVTPQPAWEEITWTSCAHPSCDVNLAIRCAPGLPAFALVGVAPILGMFVRRRRG